MLTTGDKESRQGQTLSKAQELDSKHLKFQQHYIDHDLSYAKENTHNIGGKLFPMLVTFKFPMVVKF